MNVAVAEAKVVRVALRQCSTRRQCSNNNNTCNKRRDGWLLCTNAMAVLLMALDQCS